MILNLNLNKMKYDVFLLYSTYIYSVQSNKEPFSVSINNNNQRNYYFGFNIDKDSNYIIQLMNKYLYEKLEK